VIDDFGTGYFSLSHLRQFPVDGLKIASEFVQDMDEDSKSAALAGAIIAMSRSLGIETVAEGIETSEQADRMRRLGCVFGQGYAFARPMVETDLLSAFGGQRAIVAQDTPAPQRKPRRAAAAANTTRRSLRRNIAPSPAA
jgi:EAL domain-containing protein (putative c-di-GMP-specific phosphodiesterase class I)